MKSNLTELFNERIVDLKANGIININNLIDDIMNNIQFYQKMSRQELEEFYVKSRIESLLNQNNCYSFAKDNFISLDIANLKQLEIMDQNFVDAIKGRESTLKRIREQEQMKGQMKMDFEDSKCVGISETLSIDDILRKTSD